MHGFWRSEFDFWFWWSSSNFLSLSLEHTASRGLQLLTFLFHGKLITVSKFVVVYHSRWNKRASVGFEAVEKCPVKQRRYLAAKTYLSTEQCCPGPRDLESKSNTYKNKPTGWLLVRVDLAKQCIHMSPQGLYTQRLSVCSHVLRNMWIWRGKSVLFSTWRWSSLFASCRFEKRSIIESWQQR